MKNKQQKEKKLLKPWTLTLIQSFIIVLSIALIITAHSVTSYYDAVLVDFLGELGGERVITTNNELDLVYNSMDYADTEDLDDYEKALVRTMGTEGYVLLKNDTTDGKGLPLKTDPLKKTTVSIFSHSSVDVLPGGTGSGTGSLDVNLKDAFEAQDYKVNKKLWEFYSTGRGKSYTRGIGSFNYGHGNEDWSINECPLSVLRSEKGLLSSCENTTPIFVFSRTGGEGRDLARCMNRYTSIEEDMYKHYLEPDSVELEIIQYLNDNFDNVIVVVNTNNAFELGWVENYPNIKSVLWAPGGGGQTANSIVDVLSGKVNPSGHLVDTFAYDNFSQPSMQNFGDFEYTVAGKPTGYYGCSYSEGIYVGYKYYETRYFDTVMKQGNTAGYNYSEEVLYPYGYGLSYTTFDVTNFSATTMSASGDITITCDVTNTGEVAGKYVLGVYVNTPYTTFDKENHIEKSAVSLVGYVKTDLIKPGKTQTNVAVTVNKESFITYDDVVNKTYILEKGDYKITLASDAHKACNNILETYADSDKSLMTERGDASFVTTWTNNADDFTTYSTSKNGTEVTNHFDEASFIDRTEYLTRNDWKGSWPVTQGSQTSKVKSVFSEKNGYTYYCEITPEQFELLKRKGTAEAANSPIADSDVASLAGSYGVKGDLELIDIRGKAFNDVNWDSLISQMTKDEVGYMINLSGYTTEKAESIVKPKANDLDGPMGLNLMATHEAFSIAYPAEVTIAASWNVKMSELHGDAIAQDGLRENVLAAGWYGPGVNIHRTPFSGRNFEYYSEDSFMTGTMATAAIKAAAKRGMYSFIKHFALNDQEDHRDENGLSSFACEQAIREIYLKPFQMVFECGTVDTKYYEKDASGNYQLKTAQTPVAQAVMTSFGRIGYTWAGGDYRLITEVLRNEWGFNGIVLTDYSNGAESYMHSAQMLRAGGDVQLSQYGRAYNISSAADVYYTKQAMKHVCYTVVNSNTMNGFIHGSRIGQAGFPIYYFVIIAFDTIFVTLSGVGVYKIVRRWKIEKKSKKETPENEN